MKICVISTPIFRVPVAGYSGLEHLAWQTAAGLAKCGHEVSLICPDGSSCPGVQIIPVGPERQVDEKMAFDRYWKYLLQVDCVIDETWNKWSYVLKQEGRLKVPSLGILHAPVDTMYRTLPDVAKPCFVCISEDQRAHFEALFSRPARTCHNGIDLTYYQPIGVPRTRRFLFLARFSKIKGPDLAIEACKQAGVELDLVGDTKLTGEAEYLKSILGMADGKRIRFVGPANRCECVQWFSQAWCMIHPNQRFREPLGLAPLEALACGTPVIAWNYGAMRETIGSEVGVLVQSMDDLVSHIKLTATLTDDEVAYIRRTCRNWVAANFSMERMIRRYDELCKEAVETGGW